MKSFNNADNLNINSLEITNKNDNYNGQIEQLKTNKNLNYNDSILKDITMTSLESRSRSIIQSNKNIQEGISLIQVADNSLNKMKSSAQQLKELAVTYNSETLLDKDRAMIEEKAKLYLKEIEYSCKNTFFNKENIFSQDEYFIQTGINATEGFTIKLNDFTEKMSKLFERIQGIANEPPKAPDNFNADMESDIVIDTSNNNSFANNSDSENEEDNSNNSTTADVNDSTLSDSNANINQYEFNEIEQTNKSEASMPNISQTNKSASFSIKDILSVDFIYKNLISLIKQTSHSLEEQSDILIKKINYNNNNLDIYSNQVEIKTTEDCLENIKELAKEPNKTVILNTLYTKNLNNRKIYISGLLS